MSKTKNNHYVSRFLIKNFRTEKGMPLYELDCSTRKIIERSIENMFSSRRAWSQNTEDAISKKFENSLSKYILNLINLPLQSFNTNYLYQELNYSYRGEFLK